MVDVQQAIRILFTQFKDFEQRCKKLELDALEETYLVFGELSRYIIEFYNQKENIVFKDLVLFMNFLEEKGNKEVVQLLITGCLENLLPNRDIFNSIKSGSGKKLCEEMSSMERFFGYYD